MRGPREVGNPGEDAEENLDLQTGDFRGDTQSQWRSSFDPFLRERPGPLWLLARSPDEPRLPKGSKERSQQRHKGLPDQEGRG